MSIDRASCFALDCERQPAPDSKFCARHRASVERWLDELRWAASEEDAREEWREDWNALGWNRKPNVGRLDDPDELADALGDDLIVRRGAA